MQIPRLLAYPLLLLPWLCAMVMVFWLVVQRFPPDGVASFAFAFDGKSPWFDAFLPGERVTSPGPQADGWTGQRIIREPVYASARIPGAFDTYAFTFDMRTIRQPLLEFGVQQDASQFAFELAPLWYAPLATGWTKVEDGALRGFVREGLPASALRTTDIERTLLWHASTTVPDWEDVPLAAPEEVRASLRGGLDVYTVAASGTVAFTFSIQDVNRSRGGDVVAFRLSKDDVVIATDAVGTGGTRATRPDQVFDKRVVFSGLKPGIYRLQVIADDDVFFRKIVTRQRRWVMGPRVYFADAVGYSTSTPTAEAWTNSRHLSLQTFHPEGVQEVSLGSAKTTIKKTHDVFPLSRRAEEGTGAVRFYAPNGDVRVVGDGYVAFRKDALFFPKPRRLTDQTDLDAEGIDVIFTEYTPPTVLPDGWFRARVTGSIPPGMDRLRVALSAPGILLRQGGVDVRSAVVEYTRPPLERADDWWKYVRRELAGAWRRL